MELQTARQAQRDYMENRVLSAHPVELVGILYEIAIDNLNKAIGHLKTGDAFARARAVTTAEEAVDELVMAIDPTVEAPFTRTLLDLYQYILQRIIRGHAQQSEQAFREALSILTTLAETWSGVKAKELDDAAAAAAPTAEEEPVRVAEPAANNPYSAYSQSPAVAAGSRGWSA